MGHKRSTIVLAGLLSALATLPIAAQTTADSDVVISSGIAGGGYWSAATLVQHRITITHSGEIQ